MFVKGHKTNVVLLSMLEVTIRILGDKLQLFLSQDIRQMLFSCPC